MACASRGYARESGDYPVVVGEVITSPRCAYQVVDVLGRGTFGQVLKAWKLDMSQLVALKVLKNIPSYTKQGQLEIEVLTRLSCQAAHEFNIVQAYESFAHCGHICISFELLETNLYDYLKQNRFQPLALKHIRPIAQQVLCCLQRLQELGLVHSDIKPENIMLVDHARWPFRVKVIDFGSATSISASTATSYLQSRYYRAPEVILSLPYCEAIDMWSLGCVLAELYLGWPLFPGSNEYDQISFIIGTLGKPSNNMFRNIRKACKFFSINHHDSQWTLKSSHQVKAESGIVSKETRKHIFTSLSDLKRVGSHGNNSSALEKLDCVHFVNFLATMLTFDPSGRSSPTQALQCPFITMQHLATHTTDLSVREWIQCMHVCSLSRTTNSSPPTPAPPSHPSPSHPSLPAPSHPLLSAPSHPLLSAPSHPSLLTPSHPSLLTPSYPSLLTPSHPSLLAHSHPSLLAHSHPSLLAPSLPHSLFLPQPAYLSYQPPIPTHAPQPHTLTYHLSPYTYLPQHTATHNKRPLVMSEDTGYASADTSPTSHYVALDKSQQLCLHSPALLATTHHQLYPLYLPQPPSLHPLASPHHPFSRL